MVPASVAVLERHLHLYRRLWRGTVFSSFVLPALSLLSIGLGVGSYVGDVEGTSYLAWVAPALLVSTAFQIGINESTFGILTDLEWVGGMHVMRTSPVRIRDMIAGWLLYVLAMTGLAVVAFVLVGWVFGALHPNALPAAIAVGALVSLSVALPTTAFSATVRNTEYFQLLSRFVMIPAMLFSGTFFPVSALPLALRPIAWVSPLWHGVELFRGATVDVPPAWPVVVHIGYLLLWAGLGFVWAHWQLRRRLSN